MQKVLLTFESISHADYERWDIRDFSLALHQGERVWVQCEREEQYETVWRIFQRNLKPKEGRIEEIHPVFTSSDRSIAEHLNWDSTINANFNSRLFDDKTWIGARKIHVQNLLEELAISVELRHCSLRKVSDEIFNRYWALLFMIARTKLLLGRTLFAKLDALSLPLLEQWVPQHPGALVVFGKESLLRQHFHRVLHVNEEGVVQIENCHS
ncbi:hypothetical protein WDW89_11180 [Deltaproteobacteria bacterium TL4]